MKIKMLGTAAAEGWPAIFCNCDVCKKASKLGGKNIRTRSSCLIDDVIMIDFPPDTYMHVINNNLDLDRVEYLFITHSHSDHFYPEDLFMRYEPCAYKLDIKTLEAYGNKKVVEQYSALEQKKDLSENAIDFQVCNYYKKIKIDKGEVIPLPAKHAPNEKSMIYLIKKDGKCLLYGHDSGYFKEETWDYLKKEKLDGVILECTLGHDSSFEYHMTCQDVINIKERMLNLDIIDKETKCIITHFSHNSRLMHSDFVKFFSKYDIEVAYDGIEIVL